MNPTSKPRAVFALDAEANGLWGEIFAIGALVAAPPSEPFRVDDQFYGSCPPTGELDPWVQTNVPCAAPPYTHDSYPNLLRDFAQFYRRWQTAATLEVVVHLGYIVEARLLRELYAAGLVGAKDFPFPMLDLAGHLQMVGEDPLSVDRYFTARQLALPPLAELTDLRPHHPLYDAAVCAVVYRDLRLRARDEK